MQTQMTSTTASLGNTTIYFKEGNLQDYWDVLVRRKKIVLWFAAICTALVTVISLMITPLYKATTTIVIEGQEADVQNASNSSRGMSYDIFENYVLTQMSIIRSRSVAGRVFQQLSLQEDPRYRSKKNPLDNFRKDIELEQLKGTRAVKISVFHPDPKRAANIANELAETYSRENLMRRGLSFIRNQRMASLNADFLRLQSQYDQMKNKYGPKHYEMVALKNEINDMASRIREERKRYHLLEVEGGLDDVTTPTQDESKMLDDILLQIQKGSVLSSSQINNVAVTDPAVPPTDVALPHVKLNILIGLLGSLLGGAFLAFFVDYIDDTVKTEDDLKKIIGDIPYMGSIPYDGRVKYFNKLAKIDRMIVQKPLSEVAEAYRLLRIQFHWFEKKDPNFKDFAVLSSLPDEGKSTVTSNLAIALAQTHKKVLLVDCDIRRGRLHKTYTIDKTKGLKQYLTEECFFDEIVQQTKIPDLWIVTPGQNANMGSELLGSGKMREFIEEARKKFDFIIYDTAPITLISDTSVLIPLLSGVILITRIGVTRSRLLPKSIAMVRNAHANLLGVVLNGTKSSENEYYYHRYYKN